MQKYWLLSIVLLMITCSIQAQKYSFIIRGGHVIDPKNEINEVMDVAISDGRIARVAKKIDIEQGEQIIDAKGMYVTPGLIDMHGHHFHGTAPDRYLSNSFTALAPDGFTFRSGVTTAVDAGGAGWKNFSLFKEQVIDRSQTRVLAFINIVGSGMRGVVPYEQNLDDMDPKMTSLVANQFSEIVGVKIGHYRGQEWEPYQYAVEAGELADIPVMVDLGGTDPALPLDIMFGDILRPGDILTHMYGGTTSGHGPKEGPLDEEKQLRKHWIEAQDKGLIFDVGHGGGSFFYEVAVPASKQGLWPNTISTDLHTGSMNSGMKTMISVVSKMMNLGMSLQEVILASTWKPAQVIQREDLGHLSEGAGADIAVFTLHKGDYGFLDSRGNLYPGDSKLETELTMREGKVVWDLNGIAAPLWDN